MAQYFQYWRLALGVGVTVDGEALIHEPGAVAHTDVIPVPLAGKQQTCSWVVVPQLNVLTAIIDICQCNRLPR